jgi:ribose/xylose/arabinose/galactoside ABC-type transport system permease subunit
MKHTIGKKLNGAELFSRFGILLIFVLVVLAASLASDRFLSPDNVVSVFTQCTVIGVLSCGMTMLIVSGNTDLSAGSGVALAGVVCALVVNATGSWLLSVLASLAVMLLTSAVQGVLVSYFALVPFIVTLAGQLAFRGAAQVLSNGAPIIGVGPIARISSGKLFGTPWLIIITILAVLFTWLVMNYTSFGRYIYATGGNREAANAAGINVKLMILFAYLYMGACTALAGIMLAARTNSGQPTAAVAYEFDAIIACVLGGCGMAGGVGSVAASLIGALTIGVINNCMNLAGVSPYYQSIVKGVIIIAAVLLDKKTHDAVMKAS